ncbi:MAG: carbon-nitrogen hydrolase family protein [Candidatus Heimdallarchaeota archaeon]
MTKLRIALGQIAPEPDNKAGNLRAMDEACQMARKAGAELIVFPELSLTGYVVKDRMFELAERIPGPATKILVEISKENDLSIIFGMPELVRPGILCNSAVFLSKEAVIPYRKIFLPNHGMFEEKRYFSSGSKFVFCGVNQTQILLSVCYDIFFPELGRAAMLRGAEILVCLSASPEGRQRYFELFTQARAVENSIFVIYVNQVGSQDNLSFWGGSEVISPWGKRLAKCRYDIPEIKLVELDLSEISKARRFAPMLRDVQSWLYKDLEQFAVDRW